MSPRNIGIMTEEIKEMGAGGTFHDATNCRQIGSVQTTRNEDGSENISTSVIPSSADEHFTGFTGD
jgi:hypothetical protein